MTTKKDEAVAPQETTAVATVPKGLEGMVTFEQPKYDKGELGTEGIGRGDVLLPRIGLAQKMSPEIDKTTPRYIEGLEFTDFFHSTEKAKLGKGPLHFVILRRDDPRWMVLRPFSEGGGIIDRNVAQNDPRTEWPADGKGKPEATMFCDYIVLLLDGLDMADPLKSIAALSLKSSGIKASKFLNFLIKQRGPRLICKGVYQLTSGHDTDKKSGGVYATYKFKNAGWLKEGSPLETMAIEMFEAWKNRVVEIDVDETEDDIPFEVPPGGARGDTSM